MKLIYVMVMVHIIPTYAMQADEVIISVEDTEDYNLSEILCAEYLDPRESINATIVPYLTKKIHENRNAPQAISIKRSYGNRTYSLTSHDIQFIYDLIVGATTDALREQQKKIEEATLEAQRKLSRKKAVLVAALTSVAAAITTATITFFTKGS